MNICGLQKTTLLDYPGRVASTIFLGGCNFRCPFCHNSDLLDGCAEHPFSVPDVLAFLKKRSNVLEGVCITGGEPTLHPELEDFIRKIRSLGLAVKLDTNGFRPEVLKRLCGQGLIDYAAMDIKAGRANYGRACGVPGISLAPIEESVAFLLSGAVPCEFRTTVVRELHSEEDFIDIAQWINGCSSYFLQSYQDSENVLTPGFSACSKEELLHYLDIVRPCAKTVKLRGVD